MYTVVIKNVQHPLQIVIYKM